MIVSYSKKCITNYEVYAENFEAEFVQKLFLIERQISTLLFLNSWYLYSKKCTAEMMTITFHVNLFFYHIMALNSLGLSS